jgi:hypothetical protein
MIRSVLAVLAGIAALTVTAFAIEAAANPLLMKMFPSALPNEAAGRANPLGDAVVAPQTPLRNWIVRNRDDLARRVLRSGNLGRGER